MPILKPLVSFNKRIFTLYFLLIHSYFFQTKAQQVTFNRVSSPEASYFGLITGITQDPDGYMWFTTSNRGLHRYDGYRLITYLNDPMNPHSLAVNTLEAVCADHNGIIW